MSEFKNYLPEFGTVIEYDYQPPEPATRAYPGCDESATITSVTVPALGNVEILEALESTEEGREVLRGYELEALNLEANKPDEDYERRADIAREFQRDELAMRSAQRGVR